uniref:Uncharacterized protein n=1 Tax=Ciona savignyi TaxID=51511 RepID=H2ZMY7_CIOSA
MSDVNWNFDAPQDFIDFTNIDDTDDNIDDYFNRNHEKSGLPANFIDNVEEETNQDSVNVPDVSPVKQESETELEHNEEKANSTFTIHSPSKTDQHCAIIDEVLNDETKAEEVKTDALDVETAPKLEAPVIIIKCEKLDAEKIGTEIQQGPLEKTNIKPIDTEKNTQNENESITQTEAEKTENTDPPKKPYSNIMTPSRLASWNSASRHVNAQNPKPLKNSGTSATPKAKAQMRRSLRQRENVFKPQEPPNKKQKFHHDPKKMTNHRRALTSEERQLDEVKSAKEKAKQTKRTSELSLQKIRSKSSPSWNVVSKPRLTTP